MEAMLQFWRRRNQLLILRRRLIRDVTNPFSMTRASFVKRYRLTQNLVQSLVQLLRPHLAVRTSATALSIERRVLVALSFYATGSYQTPTGDRSDLSIAQPTVSCIVEEITSALNAPEVVSALIKFPRTEEELRICIHRNRVMGVRIPDTVGFVDGSLVRIKKPNRRDNPDAYLGRKRIPCLNVQFVSKHSVCDQRLYFMNVLARFPGSTYDSFIFHRSAVRQRMIQLQAFFPCHLLGDSGYSLEPWLIVPFARNERPADDSPEARFNAVHCRDRNAVERSIGEIKERFRAINKERVLKYDPVKCGKIIVACTCLHNMCILGNVEGYRDVLPNPRPQHGNQRPAAAVNNNGNVLLLGREARRAIVNHMEQQRNMNH